MIDLLRFPGLGPLAAREPSFPRALVDMAARLDLLPNYILSVMQRESGLNPQAVNKTSDAAGLIQFMPDTATRYGTTAAALARMSAVEQLPYVERFLRASRPKIRKEIPGDYYMAVFMPAFVGYPPEFVLGEMGSQELIAGALSKGKVYNQNAGLDNPFDGKITVSDIWESTERTIRATAGKVLALPDLPLAAGPAGPSLRSSFRQSPWVSSSGASNLPVLRVGDDGSAVTLAQALLQIGRSGIFDLHMLRAVRAHQLMRKLTHDGIIGPETWESLAANRVGVPHD